MRFIWRIIIHILANSLAILAADRLIPGFAFFGDWKDLLLAGTILGIINAILKPILKFLALPIIILTLGLFSIIINIALLYFAENFIPQLQIDGFLSALGAVILISIVNNLIIRTAKDKE
ncbi:MAG TPA: phage holin family protein [Patescibacteria group bacterium]|nr:phage holin family protein [Patescibacteria group bacterium]